MGRTLDAARHYADTPNVTIEPRETAGGVFVRNQPGADALKVLHVLIDKAGPDMAEDVTHEIRLRELNAREGIRNHDRSQIREALRDLAQAIMEVDDKSRRQIEIGSVVPHANVDYRDEASGDLTIRWKFGEVFRRLASLSDLYAKLDSAALLAMRSRYAIALLRHCSTHFEKTKTNRQEFGVDHLRQVLGVPDGRLKRFADLKKWALTPAIAEINATSRWTLEATPHKTGRTVTSVTISWTEKPLAEKREVKAELDRHGVGRKCRQAGTAERIAEHPPFPEHKNGLRYNDFWKRVYDDARCRADLEKTRTGFIEWTERTGKPQTPQLFFNFCKDENERKGIS